MNKPHKLNCTLLANRPGFFKAGPGAAAPDTLPHSQNPQIRARIRHFWFMHSPVAKPVPAFA